ncbi:MAG: pyridoxal-phosphate dependent enzyme [Oscillospiraceae bacterium]|nr:pyridoxal-phosphate dependent enzyme [Oscillospiraceae bacterium]
MEFLCAHCNSKYPFDLPRWRCDCGGYLKLEQDVFFTQDDINPSLPGSWRYEKAYPLPYSEISVSFGEGMTPLVPVKFGGTSLRVKVDSLMPTGSFKDRGTVMAVNYLKNRGVTQIAEDSSGNAAASMAAYCTLGGIECSVYIPAGNSSGKIIQTRAYGAQVFSIAGTREDVAAAAQIHDRSYAGHNWHPMFEAGYKSVAYEIWEQNSFKEPDAIFTPCGGGGLTLGLAKGFSELLRSGQIAKLPKIFAAQPENCNPIYRAFHGIPGEFAPRPTIAEGTSIAKPIKLKEIVDSVRASGGQMVSVTDNQIVKALPIAWQSGIYIEPTSATAFAAFVKMQTDGEIASGDDVVIIASGNGLKATDKIMDFVPL